MTEAFNPMPSVDHLSSIDIPASHSFHTTKTSSGSMQVTSFTVSRVDYSTKRIG
ncbi:hypothetical protein [Sphingobacterium psychroaquaticum]|uniref:hypothetical protein n=1 Tax=Sphingobacterium psychroaquaticum TaxID=561061 RepID=UPI00141BD8FE|nr:hypothetical protein [Sphingobacterium psychroaquaticum]